MRRSVDKRRWFVPCIALFLLMMALTPPPASADYDLEHYRVRWTLPGNDSSTANSAEGCLCCDAGSWTMEAEAAIAMVDRVVTEGGGPKGNSCLLILSPVERAPCDEEITLRALLFTAMVDEHGVSQIKGTTQIN